LLSGCSRRAGAVAGTATVTGALAQPKTAEAPDASHGHDSGEGHGAKLSAAQQDEVITAIEQRQASEFTYPSAQAFFNAIRTHTTEGMFAAPIYGGNKDFAAGSWSAFAEPNRSSPPRA
jgi:hypothetical protein